MEDNQYVRAEKKVRMTDDAWDAIAAIALIAITVSGIVYWLSNI